MPAPSPTAVLRALRGRERLVALVGSGWSAPASIGWEPSLVLPDEADPFEAVDADPGRWLGYWGYPLLHELEGVASGRPPRQPMPRHVLARYDELLRFDGERWEGNPPGAGEPRPVTLGELVPDRPADGHQDAVRQALRHITDGDIFQVNLTTALRGRLEGDPLDLFCDAVDRLAPAFAAYVSWPGGAVVSLSPELFLRCHDGEVTTSPIKGTAPRDTDPADLLASAKDRAENVMIVDLMRNDLARVCTPGTVRAGDVRAEPHAVWHLVADVTGRLEPGTTSGDLLRATFPPGSVTGAPKVAAMQVAASLEAAERQVYTGAVGLVSPELVELNVAIRTFEVSGSAVSLGVGGGIVADSDPAAEWEECLVKARPLLAAVRPGNDWSFAGYPAKPGATVTGGTTTTLPPRRSTSALTSPTRVLFVDNYDSFVHNLVDDARRLGAHTTVVRNDVLAVDELVREYLDEEFTHLVLSPGPGSPADAGVCVELVRRLGPLTPVLGVCLGHQAIVGAYGGTVVHAPSVVHGKASWVDHDGLGVWADLPDPLLLGRYHSLVAGDLPAELAISARTLDGVVMGVRHRRHRVEGIQGHPESVLTEHGEQLLRNFLR